MKNTRKIDGVWAKCTIEDCEWGVWAREMCKRHYMKWYRHGDPLFEQQFATPEERFWTMVGPPTATGCREWTGARDRKGYGSFGISGRKRNIRAHVFSLMLSTGEDANGRHGLHRCDNPPCVEPTHLFWGTNLENRLDSVAKGRTARGSTHPMAKLSEEKVMEIRTRYAEGERVTDIANEYGVSYAVVIDVVDGRTWKHVGGPIRERKAS